MKLVLKTISLFLILIVSSQIQFAFANNEIDRLSDLIDERKSKIEELDEDIAKHQKELNVISTQKESLQKEVSTLNTSVSRIQTSIKKTETNIETSKLTLEKLALEINKQQGAIDQNSKELSKNVRESFRFEDRSVIEILLSSKSFSDAFEEVETMNMVQDAIKDQNDELRALKSALLEKANLTEQEKVKLEQYKKELSGQKISVETTKQQKDSILASTKNKESEYQKLLQEKLAERQKFEQELQEYESKLQLIVDPDSVPKKGSILSWPLNTIRITQLFGNSDFAAKNPSVYGGRAYHPGVDFGIPIGTPVKSVSSGVVTHTGNTDAIKGCYSWGKWILVKHDNGLTSLYAHLSAILVSPGERVEMGSVIGNSGNTGYSTGPHLHFGLYASQGVRVVPFTDLRATTNCKGAYTPAASADAYLDPMDYFPSL